ncbi:hypothetical protein BOTBODRAFT_45496 [Botryobasidium botryosum FD-172 SS1]|uniref:Uncharacterized protein n=1 Tax=Botryobasidium botryosum (strain FD-172 SS1) TaxID=930990 RepID=A0A067MDT3_BOTB1|nr:hypothetical protein BOTBODRAFT_45496 [Botryobasidium botryosum FD-172 SS1]
MLPFGNSRPINARKRKSTKASKRSAATSSQPNFQLINEENVVKQRRIAGQPKLDPILTGRAAIVLSFGEIYTQAPILPNPTGRTGLQLALGDEGRKIPPQPRTDFNGSLPCDDAYDLGIDEDSVAAGKQRHYNRERHRTRRTSQWNRWSNEVLPSLIDPFLSQQLASQCGRIPTPLPSDYCKPCSCDTIRSITITLATWNSLCYILCAATAIC